MNQAQISSDFGGFDYYRKSINHSRGVKPLISAISPELLDGYSAIFYFSGGAEAGILGHYSVFNVATLQMLVDWLEADSSRGMFVSGDHILDTLQFREGILLSDYLGINYVADDLTPLITDSGTSKVLFSGSDFLNMPDVDGWYVSGHCQASRKINAVEAGPDARRLGEFGDLAGQGGAYPYSAMTVYEKPNGQVTFSLPYDFRRIQPLPGWSGGGVSLRSQILLHIASFYTDTGVTHGDMTPVPDLTAFSASAYPNPFNPSTTINYTLPNSGHVTLKIFNIRGELVKTLVNEIQYTGERRSVWSGDDIFGKSVSSGVYFYELQFGAEVVKEKLMLIK